MKFYLGVAVLLQQLYVMESVRVADELALAPSDVTEPTIEWCRTDDNCRVSQGPGLDRDTKATCDTATMRCICSAGFSSRDVNGVVHYMCYPIANPISEIKSLMVRVILKMYFRLAHCVMARDKSVQSQFVAVVLQVLGLGTSRYFGSTNVCGSLHTAMDVQMEVSEMSTKLPTFDQDLGTAVAADPVLKDVLGTATPQSEYTTVEDNECELEFATKTAYLVNPGGTGYCSAVTCEYGEPVLHSTTDAFTCNEPITVHDDDLSDGAIVGIVLGSLACCCICLALGFCLVKRTDASKDAGNNETSKEAPAGSPLKHKMDDSEYNHGDPFDQDTHSDGDMEFSDVQV
eukprot:TRINITY_DN16562_c0_g2_i1.p1 TRINITY_DN16562_c0_g2~~TRINITY_DN16562_c0_g2_i1.p1  ORF type:complete len:364 (+),score=71.67 TRINITY_DN16562_c0_g2_i1:59-1093(+)